MRTAIRRALPVLLLVGLLLALGSLAALAEPPDPYFDTHLGPVPERPVPVAPGHPGGEGGLLDWSDIDWGPWADGLTANPWWATLAALAVLGISLANRNGWARATWETVGGLFSIAWNAMRQSEAGWIGTEILRRTFLPWVGAGVWAVKQVAGLPGAGKDLFLWLGQTTGENIRTVVSYVRADSQGRAQIVVDQMERARSAWETVKAFPGLLWDETKSRWSRGWNGLVRMWTDPDVSNQELLQWGADHASMAVDASVVVSSVGAAARWVKGASWFRGVGPVSQAREAVAIAKAAQMAGHSRVTTAAVLRVVRAAEQDIQFTELVAKLSTAEQDAVAFLLRKGAVELRGNSLRLTPGFRYSGNLALAPDVMPPVEARYQVLVHGAKGFNITPMSTVRKYPVIGRNGTFLTDARALEDIIGPIPPHAKHVRILSAQARRLEDALGLESFSLERENIISIVEGIPKRTPQRPLPAHSNRHFLGVGKGLKGGGPEVVITSIPSSEGSGIRQIFVEVID